MIYEVFMPALSSTMTEGKIVSWNKSEGERVEKGETIVVVESDKADMDVESFYEGYVGVIIVQAGETAPVGATVALIAETEAEIEEAKQRGTDAVSPAPEPTPQPVAVVGSVPAESAAASTQGSSVSTTNGNTGATNGATNGRLIVSPRARKLATELKVDLKTLKGSGPNGRIVAEDVEAAANKPSAKPSASVPAPATTKVLVPPPAAIPQFQAAPAPSHSSETATVEKVALTTLQAAVVRSMMASLQVPTYRVGYTITTNGLDALYKQVKSKGVTMTALLAKAVAVTLVKHPLLNASYAENAIQYRSRINVAVAVAMDDGGLITPVLQDADQTDLYQLSRNWKNLVERARLKQLQPEEYSSGSFTLSNLGMFGVDRFDAILPPNQGGILAVGASRPQVVADSDGAMRVRSQMQVNLTADHRIIYGAHAAAFLKDLAALIETNPQSLTL
ncbi:dihydrolipoamide acetyltransferase family protein [Leptolyngbya sp. FACHB-261]|uniref:dihydrolipoamide acetyltransferase family protein n=1 Tax=Leptolyngbya sp. FACHB-261 TaxID=2692806 RepID=UPI001688BC36|nr:dihydrolipoamide acetyltransferase family protein [Leptolyngbya sp. FACHB-261]MBD2102013.1 2-oxo acid dehydrogenase subunit E2 [Leptolyngbya sp. FACHB-261]